MARATFLRVRFVLIAVLALAATGAVATHRSAASNVILSHLLFDGEFVTLDPIGIERDFAQGLPEIERRVPTATQGRTSSHALGGDAVSPAWKTKPSWFIVAKNDRTIPPDLEETLAATIGARTTTLNTCHLAMHDMPFQVANVIVNATRGE